MQEQDNNLLIEGDVLLVQFPLCSGLLCSKGLTCHFYLFYIYIICGQHREITSHRMRFSVEFTNKEIAEVLEAYLCILMAFMFWRFNFMFRVISSALISLAKDRNGSFIS